LTRLCPKSRLPSIASTFESTLSLTGEALWCGRPMKKDIKFKDTKMYEKSVEEFFRIK